MNRFSTDEVPERDRLSYLHDFIAQHVAGRRYTLAQPDDYRVEIALHGLTPNALLAEASYPPITGVRAAAQLADGREDFLLTILSEPHEVSIEGGPVIEIPAGDMTIISDAVATVVRLPRNVLRAVALSRAELTRLVPRIDLQAFYHIPRLATGMPLMAGYADLLRRIPPDDEKAREAAGTHLHDLAALVLDGYVKGGAAREGKGIGAARLELVKKDVFERLRNPALDVEIVARRQGVTPRYIQLLFEQDGTTFSEFVRESRLQLAFRMLREAEAGPIAVIASDAGFHDVSNFNRSFRRRFGVTPSEVRAASMRGRAS